MESSLEFNPNDAFCLLLQGPPGAGKTTLALQFPRPYILSLDQNLGGPTRWLRKNGFNAEFKFDRPLWSVDSTGKSVMLAEPKQYDAVRKCLEAAMMDDTIDTIIVDNATILSDVLLAKVRLDTGKSRDDFRIQDWGKYLYLFDNFVNWLKNCGKMTVLIAHERPDKDDVDGIIKYFLLIPGQMADRIGGLVSDVWRCEVEESAGKHKWVVRTLPNTRLQLKQSLGLPAKFEMKWEDIAKALKANNELNKPPTPTVAT